MVNNWLITGGCGFIGSSLIKRIITDNSKANIRILDNLTVGSRSDLSEVCEFKEVSEKSIERSPEGVELLVGDICDEGTCLKAGQGVDVIVHLAANTGVGPSIEDPRGDCVTNVIGTFNMLEAARKGKVKRFVFASSGAPVGECEPPIHEELAPHPVSPYGASKLAGEGYCSAYHRSFGVGTVALRFGNVYGPRSKHKSSVIAKFIKQALSGEFLEVYGDGNQTRDFIYIDDLVNAISIAVSKADIGGEIFQIATNTETTVNDIMDRLLMVLKEKNISEVEVVNSERRLGDVVRNFSDTSKAEEILGWKAVMSLNKGIEATVDYFSAG
ncbi:MAG: NAD-dependent epimerase/dehydratase family protein [Porticoccus sp.]|nr:NAD-dependent epimerase/dehydratase family protein [Porticoccus sp.]